MEAADITEAPVVATEAQEPEVAPEVIERDANADYAELMRKQQAMAVEIELQAIANRNPHVAALIAERDALKARVAEFEAGNGRKKKGAA